MYTNVTFIDVFFYWFSWIGLHESDTPSESNDIIKEDSEVIKPCRKDFGQSRYENPEFLRAVNAVNYPFLLDSYFEWKGNGRELVSRNFLIGILICLNYSLFLLKQIS